MRARLLYGRAYSCCLLLTHPIQPILLHIAPPWPDTHREHTHSQIHTSAHCIPSQLQRWMRERVEKRCHNTEKKQRYYRDGWRRRTYFLKLFHCDAHTYIVDIQCVRRRRNDFDCYECRKLYVLFICHHKNRQKPWPQCVSWCFPPNDLVLSHSNHKYSK